MSARGLRAAAAAPAIVVLLALVAAPAPASAHEIPDDSSAMTASARRVLETLRPALRSRCLLSIDDPDRTSWSYFPGRRPGVPLEEMNDAERAALRGMLRAGLSERGDEKAEGVRVLEKILGELEGSGIRDPDLYYLTFFGAPSDERPWGWRFEGHHLSLNFSSATGRLVAATPAFFGAHPARVAAGPRAGWRLLGAEEDLARRLLASLDAAQRTRAVLPVAVPRDVILGPGRRSVPEPAGLSYADMTAAQRETLMALIGEYVGNVRDEAARDARRRIEEAGLPAIRFAWVGGARTGEPYYYRVQGPTFLIEYDNTQDGANHVHSVWRDLQNDFGGDLLRRHYAESPHHAVDRDWSEGTAPSSRAKRGIPG